MYFICFVFKFVSFKLKQLISINEYIIISRSINLYF